MTLALAAIILLAATATTAGAQTPSIPVPPPVSPAVPQAPSSSLSPILTQPWLGNQPFGHAGSSVPAPASPAPIDQQKAQSYRFDLMNQQRALENQGVSPGSEQYRTLQQQMNQLNGGR